MQTLLIVVGVGLAYIIAYFTYGRWLGQKIFNLSADIVCPSHRLRDDKDYVPTTKPIVFGHHFTSIAGTGPIVGPAIAVMWGWLPALLWVLFGSIFIGAVHDFGSLVVSLRNNGQTVGDVAGRVLNRRVRLLFLFILFLSLTIVLAIFGLVIAAVFKQYPAAIFPCMIQIPIAIIIGLWLHKKGASIFLPSLIALGIMYLTVIFGNAGILGTLNTMMASWSTITWVIILLIYSYIASVLPVWTLLQPRDYINSLQLITALLLICTGLAVAAIIGGAPLTPDGQRITLQIVAPTVNLHPADAPAIFPFLFITIACGAISGFHCLVSSGTSSKQLNSEPDARFVGYGGMLMEGFLATLVILSCVAGIGLGITAKNGSLLTGESAFTSRYVSWLTAGGLGAKISAFVDGSANYLKAMNLREDFSIAIMGVLVASFAGTTLDTACRLQRYVIQELASTFFNVKRSGMTSSANAAYRKPLILIFAALRNKHGATLLAIITAGLLASLPKPGVAWTLASSGTGGLILWPMFGATNQLLGGLAFLVIAFYLWRRKKPIWFLIFPLVFMLIMPAWAMLINIPQWLGNNNPNWPLIIIAIATLAIECWMIIEAIALIPKAKGVLEENAIETLANQTTS